MRIIEKPIEDPPNGVYSVVKEFAIAEVEFLWINYLQNEFPDEWDAMHQPGLSSVADGAVRLWLMKRYPAMYTWLEEQHVDWIGLTREEYFGHDLHETICIRMHREQDLTAFRLTWC